ncbi:hypothetical protein IB286_05905 [Spongiibacter sp. KMU-158]|uniref:Uncharacterized protein n=1 Tax=Spongiibacter pelagi TaxID=2760804 RepID=A0A927BZM8_9GAMM|nr:hypothetical protein [Spongiibacter pelagi]MBD2858539.1 hypothetical protein [Spongiibacter pelagi]
MQALLTRAPMYLDSAYLMGAIACLFICGGLYFLRTQVWKKLIISGLIQTLFCFSFFIPAIAGLQQDPVKAAALKAKQLEQDVIAYRINMPSFSVYRDAITKRRDPLPGELVFTRADKLADLKALYPNAEIDIIFSDGGIVLARIPSSNDSPNSITEETSHALIQPI